MPTVMIEYATQAERLALEQAIAYFTPTGGDGAARGEALNYFAGRRERLNYALRLLRGQSIGSGMIEGTIKQLLNRRLKQTGARGKAAHVGPFVELCALVDGPEWNSLGNN